jgi:hypothetical protein
VQFLTPSALTPNTIREARSYVPTPAAQLVASARKMTQQRRASLHNTANKRDIDDDYDNKASIDAMIDGHTGVLDADATAALCVTKEIDFSDHHWHNHQVDNFNTTDNYNVNNNNNNNSNNGNDNDKEGVDDDNDDDVDNDGDDDEQDYEQYEEEQEAGRSSQEPRTPQRNVKSNENGELSYYEQIAADVAQRRVLASARASAKKLARTAARQRQLQDENEQTSRQQQQQQQQQQHHHQQQQQQQQQQSSSSSRRNTMQARQRRTKRTTRPAAARGRARTAIGDAVDKIIEVCCVVFCLTFNQLTNHTQCCSNLCFKGCTHVLSSKTTIPPPPSSLICLAH